MSNRKPGFMIFVAGAVIGSIVTCRFIRKKYERIAQEEIDSVKDAFDKRGDCTATANLKDEAVENDDGNAKTKANQAKEKPGITEYTAMLNERGYKNYSNPGDKIKGAKNEPMTVYSPYVIAPEEFGAFDDYEQISLTFYADRVLTDDNDDPVEDVEDVIGSDSLTRFGEYEDDSVFVRNDKLRCDYEILLDQRNYSDVVKTKPREVDD